MERIGGHFVLASVTDEGAVEAAVAGQKVAMGLPGSW